MKNALLVSIMLVFIGISSILAQERYTTKTIMAPTPFYLCSPMNFNLSGNSSRTSFKIDLPANTVEWYYVFSTQKNTEKIPLNLAAQIAQKIPNAGAKVAGKIIESLTTNPGIDRCDIYVATKKGNDAFMERAYADWVYHRPTSHYEEAKRVAVSHGKAAINDVLSGTIYICVKNPNDFTGIYVNLEVVAIVDNEPEWEKADWDYMYENITTLFRKNSGDEHLISFMATCLIDSVVTAYTSKEIDNMPEQKKEQMITSVIQVCGLRYDAMVAEEVAQEEQKTKDMKKAFDYSDMAMSYHDEGDLDNCIKYSKKSLELDSEWSLAKLSCGLCLLEKGMSDEATEYYIDASQYSVAEQDKGILEIAINDLKTLIAEKPEVKGVSPILKMLESKIWW